MGVDICAGSKYDNDNLKVIDLDTKTLLESHLRLEKNPLKKGTKNAIAAVQTTINYNVKDKK